MSHPDWRFEATMTSLERELQREQVRHISLEQYQPGADHYELLQRQLADAKRFTWPSDGYQVNV